MRIAALGAGRMGRGIGLVFAYAGYRVDVVDFKPRPAAEAARLRQAALEEIGATLSMLAAAGMLPESDRPKILSRVRALSFDEAAEALGAADVIFEGVIMGAISFCLVGGWPRLANSASSSGV